MSVTLRRCLFSVAALTFAASLAFAPQRGFHVARAQDAEPMPVELIIPSLHVDAAIEQVGLDDEGGMASPSGPDSVAWFAEGFRPGDPGDAVIAGHVDWVDRAAVFWFVKNLQPGDEVDVIYDDGSSVAFAVDFTAVYDDTDTPMDQVFGPSDAPHLNLLTCSGTFNHATHNYDHRTVVYTTIMGASQTQP